MGKRGPAKTPTNLRILRGNPSQKALPKGEPQPDIDPNVPRVPEGLGKIAAAEWRRLAAQLHKVGLLTQVDLRGLEAFCDAYEKMRTASAKLRKDGLTYETVTESGSVMMRKRPEAEIYFSALAAMKSFIGEYGLTPSSRTRFDVAVKKSEEHESDEDFMLRRGRRADR